jgi:hypothetical protein
MPTVQLSGFRGIAPRLSDEDLRMQPSENGMFVRSVLNGILEDDGRIKAAPGTQTAATGTNWAASISTPAGLLVHDAGTGMLLLDPQSDDPTIVVTGLPINAQVVFARHQGYVYWLCGGFSGRIDSASTNHDWPLPQATTPVVEPAAGTLPAGKYLVSTTWVDASGAESGCSASTFVQLASSAGFRVRISDVPDSVVLVRLYMSQPNEPELHLVSEISPSLYPLLVSSLPAKSGIVLEMASLGAFPIGEGLTTCGGYLVTWTDYVVWYSFGSYAHVCDLRNSGFAFPEPVTGVVGVDGGLWVVTAGGIYWIAGKDLGSATVTDRLDSRAYASGGQRLPADVTDRLLLSRRLSSGLPGALFISNEGPVVGTAAGQLVALADDTQLWDVAGKRMSAAHTTFDGTRITAITVA